MEIKIVEAKYKEELEKKLNAEIKKLEKRTIKDIKYSVFSFREYSYVHSALIIFE
ncbi:PF10957 family protein [Fusobacterium necrophorum subsp. funduliforme ATCC 51357]|nr:MULTISPECIES: sporulation protein Cse60 [Fusobacterium]EFS22921.2 hypothetical protein FSEG_00528 [Fusobacterium necrophorum D12]EIJ72411.1 PF10957 family protein [Fusobacterium necrophorum subsp. funduliforme ATCC 51357]KAB0552932.1 sporulation protein Cse60 [Fusobacterium necrophorum subsp. funduliforme]